MVRVFSSPIIRAFSRNSLAWYHWDTQPGEAFIPIHAFRGNIPPSPAPLRRFAVQAKFLKRPRGNSAPSVGFFRRLYAGFDAINLRPLRFSIGTRKARESTRAFDKTDERRREPGGATDVSGSVHKFSRFRSATRPWADGTITSRCNSSCQGWPRSAGKTCRAAYPDRVPALVQMRREFIPLPRYYIIFPRKLPSASCQLPPPGIRKSEKLNEWSFVLYW